MCLHRTYWEEWERKNLAPYATKSDDAKFKKRISDEDGILPDSSGSNSRYKTSFQIDKERILDATAFRRLEYKTQIFVNHEGDNYRTRLTHTLEVASIARKIAKSMRLNEDLVEAIAWGHDIGHTPFGHAGEETLNDLLQSNTKGKYEFYHNFHSLKIVDKLEEGYYWDNRAVKCGLNLTLAVRDGIIKHTTRGLVRGKIFDELPDPIIDLGKTATIEGQVVALADEVAQRVNDLEDGLRSNIVSKSLIIKTIKNIILKVLDEIKLEIVEDWSLVVKNWIGKKIDNDELIAEMGRWADRESNDKTKFKRKVEMWDKIQFNKNKFEETKKWAEENINERVFEKLIRVNPLKEDHVFKNAANNRLDKYMNIWNQIKDENPQVPNTSNLLAFIKAVYISNIIEYSHYEIKRLRERSPNLKRQFDEQIKIFEEGSTLSEIKDKIGVQCKEIAKLTKDLDDLKDDGKNVDEKKRLNELKKEFENKICIVSPLDQNKLKKGKAATAEFCDITIVLNGDHEPEAHIKISNKIFKRNENDESLEESDSFDVCDEFKTDDYFIRWIASDMAVWRTESILLLVGKKENTKGVRKIYPIEQCNINIEGRIRQGKQKEDVISDNVIILSKQMEEVDKEIKEFIEMYIHRTSRVARMHTKGVSYIKDVYNRFNLDPYQLNKQFWEKYRSHDGTTIFDKNTSTVKKFIDEARGDDFFQQLLIDHIAAMTDRFLINEYERMFLPTKEIEEKEEISME